MLMTRPEVPNYFRELISDLLTQASTLDHLWEIAATRYIPVTPLTAMTM